MGPRPDRLLPILAAVFLLLPAKSEAAVYTTYTLYQATVPLTSINAAVPADTSIFVANADTPMALHGRFEDCFFKLVSDERMIWEIKPPIWDTVAERHCLIAAADTGLYRGKRLNADDTVLRLRYNVVLAGTMVRGEGL